MRNAPERVVLGVASLLLSALVAFLIVQWVATDDSPADPRPRVTAVEQVDDLWRVDVEVVNRGGRTAEQVEVVATLTLPGEEPVEGVQTIDFLAENARHELSFPFPEDPGSGELEVRVTAFGVP